MLFAAVMRADVCAISYPLHKNADATALGANGFVCLKDKDKVLGFYVDRLGSLGLDIR